MRLYNFSAGPAVLPSEVVKATKKALIDYNGTGVGIMEISHRSDVIIDLFCKVNERISSLLKIPSNYQILWLQGGASLQFSMVPMNILPSGGSADYIETGTWSVKAAKECEKIGSVNVVASSKKQKFSYIPKNYTLNKSSSYLHITSNNTIYGTQYKVFPEVNPNQVLVADMSSDILSKSICIKDFGLIYAGAQKNIGPAGVTLVIIRKDLVGLELRSIPSMLDYQVHVESGSMFNTPPVLPVFVVNETLKWIKDIGGLSAIEHINKRKANKLYQEIERNSLFYSPIQEEDRSIMNIPFVFYDSNLIEDEFLSFCKARGLGTLKGHRSIGGFRASIYNAMPESGIDALIHAMREYEKL